MIREASYDSLLSELGAALSVNEDIGASTEGMLDRLEGDVSDLRRVFNIVLVGHGLTTEITTVSI